MRSSTKPRKHIPFNQQQRLKFLYIMQQFERRVLPIDFGNNDSRRRSQDRLLSIDRRIRAIRSSS